MCRRFGFRAGDGKLIVVDSEVEIVRFVFRRYAELGSVRRLNEELDPRGVTSKSWTSAAGRGIDGKPFSRGALYLMLQHRVYRGEMIQKDNPIPANIPRSSISPCGMRFRRSSSATPPNATLAYAFAGQACSSDCCSMATVTE